MTRIQEKLQTFIDDETPLFWITENWKDIPSCYLYDFFDSIGINVSTPPIPQKNNVSFGAQIMCHINGEDTKVWNYLALSNQWVEFNYNAIDIVNNFALFATRKEAEIIAFTKAFELAETIVD